MFGVVTGCTGPSSAPSPAARSAQAAPSPSDPQAAGISAVRVAGLTLPGDEIGPPAMDDRRVVFPIGGSRTGGWDRVGSFVLDGEAPRIVARSQWATGLINWVAVAGDWVAWVDQDHRQGDDDPRVLWRVRALNTSTHERRLLATNGDVADPYVPQVHGHGQYLFWTQAEHDRSARERLWRPGWAEPRDLLRHTEMTPGSESVAHGRMVYLGPSGRSGHGHTVGGDCWAVPVDGSRPPRPLTRTSLAMGCAAAGGSLVWTEHVDPSDPPPAEGLLDDPYEVRASGLAGGRDRLLHRGYLPTGYPVAGRGFVLWHGPGAHLVAHSTSSGAALRLPRRADRIASDGGDLVTYATVKETGTTVSVVRVTLPR